MRRFCNCSGLTDGGVTLHLDRLASPTGIGWKVALVKLIRCVVVEADKYKADCRMVTHSVAAQQISLMQAAGLDLRIWQSVHVHPQHLELTIAERYHNRPCQPPRPIRTAVKACSLELE